MEGTGQAWADALGHTIKVRRTDVGLSRQQLADASAISYSYLSAIENGAKVPSTKILLVLADRLGLDAVEFLGLVDERLAREDPEPDTSDLADSQEARFRERQQARLERKMTSVRGADRQALVALIDTLPSEDVAVITHIAEAFHALHAHEAE